VEKRVFQLRFRASELLYVREGRQALVDRKPFSQSDLEKTNHFLFRKAMRTVPGVVEQLLLCRSFSVSQYRDSKTPCA
jgi:hypothetical protein